VPQPRQLRLVRDSGRWYGAATMNRPGDGTMRAAAYFGFGMTIKSAGTAAFALLLIFALSVPGGNAVAAQDTSRIVDLPEIVDALAGADGGKLQLKMGVEFSDKKSLAAGKKDLRQIAQVVKDSIRRTKMRDLMGTDNFERFRLGLLATIDRLSKEYSLVEVLIYEMRAYD
jgi:hypothetical protein